MANEPDGWRLEADVDGCTDWPFAVVVAVALVGAAVCRRSFVSSWAIGALEVAVSTFSPPSLTGLVCVASAAVSTFLMLACSTTTVLLTYTEKFEFEIQGVKCSQYNFIISHCPQARLVD